VIDRVLRDSITVAHLLGHRSGIPHEVIPDSEMVRPFTAAEVVERAKKLPLDFPPGARESYSSGGSGDERPPCPTTPVSS